MYLDYKERRLAQGYNFVIAIAFLYGINIRHKRAKGMEMIDSYHENQGSNWKFTMGDKNDRSDRAPATFKQAKLVYKREIKNLELSIRQLKREQEKIADHPLTDDQASEIASAIDSGAYVSKEVQLGVKIRDLETILKLAKKRFQFLFGDE
jgi:hypothetical protein